MNAESQSFKNPLAFLNYLPSGMFGFGFAIGLATGLFALLLAA